MNRIIEELEEIINMCYDIDDLKEIKKTRRGSELINSCYIRIAKALDNIAKDVRAKID